MKNFFRVTIADYLQNIKHTKPIHYGLVFSYLERLAWFMLAIRFPALRYNSRHFLIVSGDFHCNQGCIVIVFCICKVQKTKILSN
ncbi:hypothetical protein [Flavobacterium saliperosum]|uniref:Uncharacterized protein n=1 Tax=Flavobacterium saliperosum TaxID=329186 RepID=A0A1G4VMC0_9FLAO|nr:hypothetical protein [Flavobacterium saliperosum]SCX08960.1 hypothetical protein SAMN02927925_01293 [Flavobacterium saliperosum]